MPGSVIVSFIRSGAAATIFSSPFMPCAGSSKWPVTVRAVCLRIAASPPIAVRYFFSTTAASGSATVVTARRGCRGLRSRPRNHRGR